MGGGQHFIKFQHKLYLNAFCVLISVIDQVPLEWSHGIIPSIPLLTGEKIIADMKFLYSNLPSAFNANDAKPTAIARSLASTTLSKHFHFNRLLAHLLSDCTQRLYFKFHIL